MKPPGETADSAAPKGKSSQAKVPVVDGTLESLWQVADMTPPALEGTEEAIPLLAEESFR